LPNSLNSSFEKDFSNAITLDEYIASGINYSKIAGRMKADSNLKIKNIFKKALINGGNNQEFQNLV
jgi:hypothetical protein